MSPDIKEQARKMKTEVLQPLILTIEEQNLRNLIKENETLRKQLDCAVIALERIKNHFYIDHKISDNSDLSYVNDLALEALEQIKQMEVNGKS